MSRRLLVVLAMVMGSGAVLVATVAAQDSDGLPYRAYAPGVSRAEAEPTPTPRPIPYNGPIESLYLASAQISAKWAVETRDTKLIGGKEVFQDPTAPQYIAWYPRFGQPGFTGHNTILAAHIDYVGFGKGPFGYLTSASAGDALHVTMDNGSTLTYTVRSVSVVKLAALNMDDVVFPNLPAETERITLISCGGTFVPYPGGGGEYDSRVILVAERTTG